MVYIQSLLQLVPLALCFLQVSSIATLAHHGTGNDIRNDIMEGDADGPKLFRRAKSDTKCEKSMFRDSIMEIASRSYDEALIILHQELSVCFDEKVKNWESSNYEDKDDPLVWDTEFIPGKELVIYCLADTCGVPPKSARSELYKPPSKGDCQIRSDAPGFRACLSELMLNPMSYIFNRNPNDNKEKRMYETLERRYNEKPADRTSRIKMDKEQLYFAPNEHKGLVGQIDNVIDLGDKENIDCIELKEELEEKVVRRYTDALRKQSRVSIARNPKKKNQARMEPTCVLSSLPPDDKDVWWRLPQFNSKPSEIDNNDEQPKLRGPFISYYEAEIQKSIGLRDASDIYMSLVGCLDDDMYKNILPKYTEQQWYDQKIPHFVGKCWEKVFEGSSFKRLTTFFKNFGNRDKCLEAKRRRFMLCVMAKSESELFTFAEDDGVKIWSEVTHKKEFIQGFIEMDKSQKELVRSDFIGENI